MCLADDREQVAVHVKKFLKWLAWLLGAVAVLLVVVAAALPLFFDPNDHKDRIAALASQHAGRDIKIDGDIALSIFPWLGVRLPTVEIGNAPGFPEPIFAKIDEMQLRVKLLPLFVKRIEMDRLTVRGLTVNLSRRGDGVSNWDDLAARGAAGADSKKLDGGAATALALGGLDILGAAIRFDDRQSEEIYAVTAIDLHTGALSPGVPVDYTVAFDVEQSPVGIGGRVASSGSVRLAPDGNTLQAENVTLQANLEGVALPGGKATLEGRGDANFDIASRRLSLSRLELDGSGFTIADRPGRISVKSSFVADLAAQDFRLPDLELAADLGGAGDQSEQARGSRLEASGDVGLSVGSGALTVRSLKFSVPELNLAAASGALSGGAEVSANLQSRTYAVSAITAQGALSHAAPREERIQFDLNGAVDGNFSSGIHEARIGSLAAVVKRPDIPAGELTATLMTDVGFDANQRLVNARNLRLETAGVSLTGNLSASDAAGVYRLHGALESETFSPRTLFERLGMAPAIPSDPKLLRSASIKTGFAVTADSAKLERMVVALDDSRISGDVAISGFETPALEFDVAVDQIDLDRYLASPAATGAVKRTSATSSTSATPGAMTAGATAIPVETLRRLNAKGRLAAGRLKAGGVALADVRAAVEARGGLIKAVPLSAKLYGGSYRGNVSLDARGDVTRISVDETLADVRIDELMHDLNIDLGATDLSGNSTIALKAGATGDASGRQLRVDSFDLEARLAGKSAPGGVLAIAAKGRLDVDMEKQTLHSDELEIGIGDLVTRYTVQATNLLGEPSYRGTVKSAAFNPRKVLKQLGQKDIVTTDPKALSSADFEAHVNGTTSNVNVESLAVTLDNSRLEGTLAVTNFAAPAIRFDLSLNDLNLDRYLPPPPQGGQAPVGTPGATMSVVPTETLRRLDLDGQLRIAQMKLANLRLSDVQATAKAKDGVVNLHPLAAKLYEGNYTGNVRIDARGERPLIQLDESLEQVQLGQLLQDLRGEQPVTGEANLHAKLTATGPDADTIKRTLSGDTRFALANGEVKGLDFIGQLCALASAVSLTSGRKENIIAGVLQLAVPQEAKTTGRTPFTDLSGTVNFADGRATNDDLVLTSPVLDFGGRGNVDLTSLAMDYRGIARLSGSCADRIGRSFSELRGRDIPVHISGLLGQLNVDANFAGLLQAFGEKGGKQAPDSQPQAGAKSQQPSAASGQGTGKSAQGTGKSGKKQPPPAPPAKEDVLRGILKGLTK